MVGRMRRDDSATVCRCGSSAQTRVGRRVGGEWALVGMMELKRWNEGLTVTVTVSGGSACAVCCE